MISDQMIIDRLRRVCEDLRLSNTDFGTKYHVSEAAAADAKVYKACAVLEVIADELEEYQQEAERKQQQKEAAA